MKTFPEYLTGDLTLKKLIYILRFKVWGIKNAIIDAPVYSRWGDGEFAAMFQEDGTNCDNHKYYPSLGFALESTLKKQLFFGCQYYYALVPIAIKVYGDRIQKYIDSEISIKAHQPNWVSGNLFMEANREGKLGEFFSVLRSGYKILYVGPSRLRVLSIDQFINIGAWVDVPEINAWAKRDEIIREIIYRFFRHDCNMICFSAGMSSKVWISDLKLMFGDKIKVPMFDFGSMWDGYYGFNSRKYHSDYDWDKIRRMNLE